MDSEGTLGLFEERDRTRIAWYFDGDEGAMLGEQVYRDAHLKKAKRDDYTHVLATITASRTEGVEHDSSGYYWESAKAARSALRVIKDAIKNDTGAPWPEWAVKAKGEGWTPPKGWKP